MKGQEREELQAGCVQGPVSKDMCSSICVTHLYAQEQECARRGVYIQACLLLGSSTNQRCSHIYLRACH